MADQSYGLRFDIYERVHLSDDVVGIEELEEIELLPKIQVIPGEEYAALRGHLLLSGLYRGQGESRELEHWIPVEITIPLSRVNKLEDIAVEIENFDVDLLSARSLNITGVLSLQGVETTSLTAESDEWRNSEFTAAHESFQDTQHQSVETHASNMNDATQAIHATDSVNATNSTNATNESSSPFDQELQLSAYQQEWHEFPPSMSFDYREDGADQQGSTQTEGLQQLNDEQEREQEQQELQEQEMLSWTEDSSLSSPALWTDKEPASSYLSEVTREPELAPQEDSNVWFREEAHQEILMNDEPASAEIADEQENSVETAVLANNSLEEDSETEIRPQPEEKKELKIALNSKKNDAAELNEEYGISKLLSTQRPNKDSESELQSEEENAHSAAEQERSEEEEIRWKNLFIGRDEDQSPFRKIRMVIVQREETLEEIAERYNLSIRELQLYNRLAEHSLAEGQVLYIP